MSYSTTLLRGAVALTLAGAAVLKLVDALHVMEHQHALVSVLRQPSVALPVATVELVVAVALLTRQWRPWAMAAFGLSSVFVVMLAAIVMRGLPPSACGCFGGWQAPVAAHFGLVFGLPLASRELAFGGEPATAANAAATAR